MVALLCGTRTDFWLSAEYHMSQDRPGRIVAPYAKECRVDAGASLLSSIVPCSCSCKLKLGKCRHAFSGICVCLPVACAFARLHGTVFGSCGMLLQE